MSWSEFIGRPRSIHVDNGPEFTAEVLVDWCRERDTTLRFIQLGKPDQNAHIEQFNRSYRQGVLDAYVFKSINEVRVATEEWL